MPNVNVYRDLYGETRFFESISLAERDARIANMTNVDPAGMPKPYSYRDEKGTVWGFAEAATDEEIAAMHGGRVITPEQEAKEWKDLCAQLGWDDEGPDSPESRPGSTPG